MVDNIKNLKGQHQYINDIDVIYGKLGDYYFTTRSLDRKNMICFSVSVKTAETVIPDLNSLRNKYDAIPYGGVYQEGREICVEMNILNIPNVETFNRILSEIEAILSKNRAENQCSETGRRDDIGIYRVGTKVKILSSSSFGDQVNNRKKNYKHTISTNTPLAWIATAGVLIGMMIVWGLVGRIFFLISAMIAAAGLRLAFTTFQKFAGHYTKKDASIIIGLFFFAIIISDIAFLAFNIALVGFPILEAIKLAILSTFINPENISAYLVNVATSVVLALWGSWSLIQDILGGASRGKRVSRKNVKLL